MMDHSSFTKSFKRERKNKIKTWKKIDFKENEIHNESEKLYDAFRKTTANLKFENEPVSIFYDQLGDDVNLGGAWRMKTRRC